MIASIVATVLAAAGVAAWRLNDWPAHHFDVAVPGVLLRSGQPGRYGWRHIFDTHDVRTVVSVREIDPEADWYQLEQDVCAARDARLVRMPIETMTDAELVDFAAIVAETDHRPVLVHCEAGSVRTGVIVAAYRIAVEGWSFERALADAGRFRLHDRRCKPFVDYLRDLAARVAAGDNPVNSGRPPRASGATR